MTTTQDFKISYNHLGNKVVRFGTLSIFIDQFDFYDVFDSSNTDHLNTDKLNKVVTFLKFGGLDDKQIVLILGLIF